MITTTPRDGGPLDRQPNDTGPIPVVGQPDGAAPQYRLPKSVLVLAGALLLAVIVAFAGAFYVLSPIDVEVSIDGETQTLSTRAGSVDALLSEMDLTLTGADHVEPALDTELVEGDLITVRYARPLTVVIDGAETEHETTMLTVGDALDEMDAPTDGASISTSLADELPRAGMTVEIVTPKLVSVNIGGEVREATSTAATVGDLLAVEAIELGETDTVSPDVTTPVTDGISVVVTRIRVENEIRTETIPHETSQQDDPDSAAGSRTVVTEGVDGSQDVTYAVTYTNGEMTSEEVVSSLVTLEPVTEVVSVGTKQLASADLNWAALAQCESSGNPTAVNPAGYYGLYQFSLPTWASVGGTGNPVDASPEEQTMRAQILLERSGVGQWPHCGPRLYD